MNYKFSVIIPHSNIPDLLMRCLDSIPVREDIQVIVVDDHSSEGEHYLDNYPALSRPYLTYIHAPKQGGAGYARNLGIDAAEGKWLLFADADDFFLPGAFDIIDTYCDSLSEIVFFRTVSVKSDDITVPSFRDEWIDKIFEEYYQTKDEWILRSFHRTPHPKLFLRSFIEANAIRFDEVKYGNDVLFCVKAGCLAQSIEVCNENVYCLCERNGSLVSSYGNKPREPQCRLDVGLRAYALLKSFGHEPRQDNTVLDFLWRLYKVDRSDFHRYFAFAKECGVPRWRYLIKGILVDLYEKSGLWKILSAS